MVVELFEEEDDDQYQEVFTLTHQRSKADQEIRELLVRNPRLKFATLYKTVQPEYMHWWWAVDVGKKFLIDAAYLNGLRSSTSLWKFHVFLIVSSVLMLSSWVNPYPSRSAKATEQFTSTVILIMLCKSTVDLPLLVVSGAILTGLLCGCRHGQRGVSG